MKTMTHVLIGATIAFAPAVQAAEITGGSVELSYSSFTEDSSVRRTGIEGSMEIGFNRNFSTQIDLTHHRLNASDNDVTTLAVHGIYHLDDATSFGVFYAIEDTSQGDFDYYGIEAGHEVGQFEFEGFLARADANAEDADVVGVSARYDFGNSFGVTGSYEYIDIRDVDLSTATLRVDRDVAQNVNLFLEIGSARASAGGLSGTETFVGLGGKITFGADRGATFDARGLSRLVPGG